MNTQNQMVAAWKASSEARTAERAAAAAWDRDPESASAWKAWRAAEDRWMEARAMSDAAMNRHMNNRAA